MLLRSDRSIVRVRRPLPTSTLSIAPTRCRRPGATDTFFLVTLKLPRSWRAVDNHRLRLCARRFANAYLIDWYAYSHDHPGWFARRLSPDLERTDGVRVACRSPHRSGQVRGARPAR